MLNFDGLYTPPDDGGTLIEPSADRWRAMLEENFRLRDRQRIVLAGRPVDEVRRELRAHLVTGDSGIPLIASGHQPAFVHPGVWAKHVIVRAMAARLGLRGLDLVVDNDAPASRGLEVPRVDAEQMVHGSTVIVTEAPTGSPYEGTTTLDQARVDTIRQEAASIGDGIEGNSTSLIGQYLNGLSAATGARDFVEQHLKGRERIDRDLEADLPEVRVSDAFGGPFLADLLLSAERFAGAYNESLAEYRAQQRVRTANRPLPDLGSDGSTIETAFWIYQPLHARRRLWVRSQGAGITLLAEQQPVGVIGRAELQRDAGAALSKLHPWVIRPRALTLTLWARLLACDLFVHGIGGAKYDRITDGIFRRYWGCEPPAYACVSATLRLPLPMHDVSIASVGEAARRVRDFQFNPQRYVSNPPAEWLNERIGLIDHSTRLREESGPPVQRRETFTAIRRCNARVVDAHPEVGERLSADWRGEQRRAASNAAAASREYFYALQPRERLVQLRSRLLEAAGLPER